jgi:ribonuclease P protein component
VKKITRREEFDAVMAAGVCATTSHFALHAVTNSTPTPFRIGAVVPKRWAKRAVMRNSIRRQIYNIAKREAHAFSNMDLVIRLRKSFSDNEYISAASEKLKKDVRLQLEQLLAKSIKQT